MTEERDKTREAIVRGDQAKHLLENDLLNKYWQDVEQSIFQKLKFVDVGDEKKRLELHAMILAIQGIKKDFKQYMQAGERAKTKLAELSKREKLKKRLSK